MLGAAILAIPKARFCFLTLAIACLFGACSVSHAEMPVVRVSATRIGEHEARICVAVYAPTWHGLVPAPGGDVVSSLRFFAVNGGFGMPTNLVPPGHHRVIEMARGDIVWGAEWLAPVLCTGFDLEIAEDMLVFEYRSIVEYFQHYQSSEGWDRFGILDTEITTGRVQGQLPATIGDSILLVETPLLPVATQTWSGVKNLYR